MKVIHKAYESVPEVSEKLNSELTRLILLSDDRKIKIDSLEIELIMVKVECIILNDKCGILVSERNL